MFVADHPQVVERLLRHPASKTYGRGLLFLAFMCGNMTKPLSCSFTTRGFPEHCMAKASAMRFSESEVNDEMEEGGGALSVDGTEKEGAIGEHAVKMQ